MPSRKENIMKNTAMEEIAHYLYLSGLTEIEVNHLLAKLLEEEAKNYIEAMNLVENDNNSYIA